MADDHLQRPFRKTELPSRATPAANNPPAGGNDPLAELARLIGQNDPFGEFGRQATGLQAQPTTSAVPGYASHDPYPAQAPVAAQGVLHGAEDAARQPYGSLPLAGGGDVYQTQEPVPGYGEHPAGMSAYEDASYDPGVPPYSGEDQDFYDDVPPPRRRMGVLAIAAVFALAVIGTAGAFGYRALFGSAGSGPPPVIKADSKPAKIVPVKDQSAKLINDRINDHSGDQKLVSREEKPVDLNKDNSAGVMTQDQAAASSGSMQAPALGSGVIGSDPKKVHTITIHPDEPTAASAATVVPPPPANVAAAMPEQSAAAPEPAKPAAHEVASPPPKPAPAPRQVMTRHPAPAPHQVANAAPRNAPLSLTPDSVASMRTASTASHPAHPTPRLAPSASRSAGSGYAVQVSSRRSEADAQAAVHRMQSKFASVIGSQPVMVRRVDLGAKGVYYRAMVGPFSNSDQATKLCSRLKAAGGSCFVQRI